MPNFKTRERYEKWKSQRLEAYNDKKRMIIVVTLVVMILMGIFPPWKASIKTDMLQ